ncbi:permease [Rossellomorea vietnamensis]|uniref:permease n=1 Tax=Rossellomorea vietnamensis TaxID=218284 RepID=UPI003084720F|nr:permease [Rossellomorea vietnamensis]WQI95230.1 permease [Rossellomorea vietnamensis]
MKGLKKIGQDLTGLFLFILIIGMFLAGEFIKGWVPEDVFEGSLVNVITIFLSILLEAIPFILIGVFASALIQVFVSESLLQRLVPKRLPYLALLPAVLVGALLPVCECAIVPVARRLIKKGMPTHLAIVIMVTAPILNPIVLLSTYYAFQNNLTVVTGRMAFAFIAALIIGALLYKLFGRQDPLKQRSHDHEHHHGHDHEHSSNKLMQTLVHASDEFFDMGKFLIIGALLAALFQTYIDRETIVTLGSNNWAGPGVMMGFAYIMSLCSEADAFVASSFGNLFSTTSLLAFLVYGPMIDFKNTLLMLAYFKKSFVLLFMAVVTVTVYVITVGSQIWL